MKKYALLCLTFIIAVTTVFAKPKAPASIYDFKIKALDGSIIDFSAYKGKKILIVNTASKCGYTKQYKGLEELYKSHKDNLVIIGFPSDNFGGQEYQEDSQIKDFCEKNFGVSFPLTTRVDVKGDNATPVFQYLCQKAKNGVLDATIGWNFNKFIIDEKGNLLAHFDSKIAPDSPELLKYIN
jgi:glutathione peroxidase